MVMKFCSLSWLERSPAVPRNNHNTDENPAVTKRKQSLVESAWDNALQSQHQCRWEREFSVLFDDKKPIGLGFQHAVESNKAGLVSASNYTCAVRDVASIGLAADYNAHCRAAGDYTRIIVDKMRVRMVNGIDVADVPYTDVLQMMRDGKPRLTLTLADITSALVVFEERSKSLGSLAPQRSNRRRSSLSMGINKGQNYSTSFETMSHSLQLPEATTSSADVSVLGTNIETEYHETRQQLEIARMQNNTLQLEHDEALKKEQDVAAQKSAALTQEMRKMQQERDDMVAVNKLLLRQRRTSMNTQNELETMKIEQLQLQHRQKELEQTVKDLQTKLAEKTLVAEENGEQVSQLRHEKDMLALQWQELNDEHRDTQCQVGELHDRLVETQRAHRAIGVVLAALRTAHAAKTQQVQELQAALKGTSGGTSTQGNSNSTLETELKAEDKRKSLLSTRTLQEWVKDTNSDLNQIRDKLLVELACHDQQLSQLQEQICALELVNTTSKKLLTSLHDELREAQNRECNMRVEFSSELELVRKNIKQEAQSQHNDLERQITELEQRCEKERIEKDQLQAILNEHESVSRASNAAQEKDREFLVQFKKQLENGIVVTKFGARGVPHQRVVYADGQCQWISWRSPGLAVPSSSLTQSKTDTKVHTYDLVEVMPGAITETFTRQRPDAPSCCFSLVFVRPCRTLDLQVESAAQCQHYIRGFRLLQQEAAPKRR